jgi:hypothetical protein
MHESNGAAPLTIKRMKAYFDGDMKLKNGGIHEDFKHSRR